MTDEIIFPDGFEKTQSRRGRQNSPRSAFYGIFNLSEQWRTLILKLQDFQIVNAIFPQIASICA
ncbi:hypothetical protein [Acetobacter nitrogenifigens]|uniref:hypothetical protein n=1 Tax=Acetobacter nitrogenifigens TaxID=285268 RepID=UPI0003FF29A1|nr:hypothetical protein [Acetobacter nitrogenifigens]